MLGKRFTPSKSKARLSIAMLALLQVPGVYTATLGSSFSARSNYGSARFSRANRSAPLSCLALSASESRYRCSTDRTQGLLLSFSPGVLFGNGQQDRLSGLTSFLEFDGKSQQLVSSLQLSKAFLGQGVTVQAELCAAGLSLSKVKNPNRLKTHSAVAGLSLGMVKGKTLINFQAHSLLGQANLGGLISVRRALSSRYGWDLEGKYQHNQFAGLPHSQASGLGTFSLSLVPNLSPKQSLRSKQALMSKQKLISMRQQMDMSPAGSSHPDEKDGTRYFETRLKVTQVVPSGDANSELASQVSTRPGTRGLDNEALQPSSAQPCAGTISVIHERDLDFPNEALQPISVQPHIETVAVIHGQGSSSDVGLESEGFDNKPSCGVLTSVSNRRIPFLGSPSARCGQTSYNQANPSENCSRSHPSRITPSVQAERTRKASEARESESILSTFRSAASHNSNSSVARYSSMPEPVHSRRSKPFVPPLRLDKVLLIQANLQQGRAYGVSRSQFNAHHSRYTTPISSQSRVCSVQDLNQLEREDMVERQLPVDPNNAISRTTSYFKTLEPSLNSVRPTEYNSATSSRFNYTQPGEEGFLCPRQHSYPEYRQIHSSPAPHLGYTEQAYVGPQSYTGYTDKSGISPFTGSTMQFKRRPYNPIGYNGTVQANGRSNCYFGSEQGTQIDGQAKSFYSQHQSHSSVNRDRGRPPLPPARQNVHLKKPTFYNFTNNAFNSKELDGNWPTANYQQAPIVSQKICKKDCQTDEAMITNISTDTGTFVEETDERG